MQLRLTWELTGVAGFVRPSEFLANFWFPPAHWAQFALPEVFLGRPRVPAMLYWNRHGTTPGEACAYVGIVPSDPGLRGSRCQPRSSGPGPLAAGSCRCHWPWRRCRAGGPTASLLLMQLPGLGWFRAPARYTLLTSLGLAFWLAGGWIILVTRGGSGRGSAWRSSSVRAPGHGRSIGRTGRLPGDVLAEYGLRFGSPQRGWPGGRARGDRRLAAILARRVGTAFARLPRAGRAVLRSGRLRWGRQARLRKPARCCGGWPSCQPLAWSAAGSTICRWMRGKRPRIPTWESHRRRRTTCSRPPRRHPVTTSPVDTRWQRRFGVTHGVWGSADSVCGADVLADRIPDPALDQVMDSYPISRRSGLGPWKLVQLPMHFPPAWVAREVREAPSWRLSSSCSRSRTRADEAWFEPGDLPPSFPATDSLAAASAKVGMVKRRSSSTTAPAS